MTEIQRLLSIMEQLRNPQTGCPWDIKQDHQSLIPYLVEEAYEVVDALEDGETKAICNELGDLLFQVVFHARVAQEHGNFDFEAVAKAVSDKLVRRHPHVFADTQYASDSERNAAWDTIKASERAANAKDAKPIGALAGVAKAQPALMRAEQLQRRAARVGFDWPNVDAVFPKVEEELEEIKAALAQQESQQRVEEELGDLLFSVTNLARHLKIDAEQALRRGNEKFERRFAHVEATLSEQGLSCEHATLEQMEAAWILAKGH